MRGDVEDVLTFPLLMSPYRAEADQKQLDPSEDARLAAAASERGAAEGHRVLPLVAGGRAS